MSACSGRKMTKWGKQSKALDTMAKMEVFVNKLAVLGQPGISWLCIMPTLAYSVQPNTHSWTPRIQIFVFPKLYLIPFWNISGMPFDYIPRSHQTPANKSYFSVIWTPSFWFRDGGIDANGKILVTISKLGDHHRCRSNMFRGGGVSNTVAVNPDTLIFLLVQTSFSTMKLFLA